MKFYEEVVELWRKSGISVGSTDTKEELERVVRRTPQLFLVGKIDEKIISVVIGGFDGRRGYVHHLAVDPDYQKKGYGKMIMGELMNKFLKLKVHKVHLFLEKYNKEVVEFYRNLGWEIRDDLIMMSYIPDKNLYKMRI
ncbi:MAG: GNAT family N-acetyltransferase [Candidatus Lokiarchaeota archaeon]|nr:GNAT family N-acetyltransferase [Candidatus Lokiarchaeota archaeon]